MPENSPTPEPDIGPLHMLVGTWSGEGAGEYPTINSFRYLETVVFTAPPKPFLHYHQSTRHPETNLPMHTESGYLRVGQDAKALEFMNAQPTGVVEIYEGTWNLNGPTLTLHLRSTHVARTATAKLVESVERIIEVTDTELRYTMAMGSVGQTHQHHLRAVLKRA